MKKASALLLLVLLVLVGCSGRTSPASTSQANGTGAVSQSASASTAPAAGAPHEGAILAAVPGALKEARRIAAEEGYKLPDVSGATAKIDSYQLVARTNKGDYLFEVFGDGQAYELFAYPEKPNPATLEASELTPEEASALQAPLGEKELAAAKAVRAVMTKTSFGAGADILMYGYSVQFVGKDGKPVSFEGDPFIISIDPKGKLADV